MLPNTTQPQRNNHRNPTYPLLMNIGKVIVASSYFYSVILKATNSQPILSSEYQSFISPHLDWLDVSQSALTFAGHFAFTYCTMYTLDTIGQSFYYYINASVTNNEINSQETQTSLNHIQALIHHRI